MATQREYYELYRRSSIGFTMLLTLDEMVNEQLIEPQLAFIVMNAFDRAAADRLAEVKSKMTFKGNLDVYRFCDEVWTFMIKNVTFKLDNNNNQVTADRIKIVSCNAKRPGET